MIRSKLSRLGIGLGAAALVLSACSTEEDDAATTDEAEDSITTDADGNEVSNNEDDNEQEVEAEETEPVTVDSPVTEEALDLDWYVVGVDLDDEEGLNVRATPGTKGKVVGSLEMWETGFEVTSQVQSTGVENWRQVELADGTEGWVNERFIIAQPTSLSPGDEAGLTEIVSNLTEAAVDGDSSSNNYVAERGLWALDMGSWHHTSANKLAAGDDWSEVIIKEAPDAIGEDQCEEEFEACNRNLVEFLGLDQLDESTEQLVDDRTAIGSNGIDVTQQAPASMHWVVSDRPGTAENGELDWQRTYFIFDWSTGEPKVSSISSYHWTI